MSGKKEHLSCSFCGREKKDTSVLIAGIHGHICDNCIKQAGTIVHEEMEEKERSALAENLKLTKPQEIKSLLDEYVIGQDEAKKCFRLLCTTTIKDSSTARRPRK